jgi:hypothetical protein
VRQRCHTLFIALPSMSPWTLIPVGERLNPGMDSSAQTLHTDADSNVRLSVREFPSHPCFCRIRESPWRFTSYNNHSIISAQITTLSVWENFWWVRWPRHLGRSRYTFPGYLAQRSGYIQEPKVCSKAPQFRMSGVSFHLSSWIQSSWLISK